MTTVTYMQNALFLTKRGATRCAERLQPDPLVRMVGIRRIAPLVWQVAWALKIPELEEQA